MINKNFKEKRDEIFKEFGNKLSKLGISNEDIVLIEKLTESYCRKIKGISNSRINTTAAGILWAYSKINFFWEGDPKWGRQGLADLFGANAKTVGDKATEIMQALRIQNWDDRFARKSVADENPLKDFVMLPSGMVTTKDSIPEDVPFKPLKMTKEDYYYDGLEYFGEEDTMNALICFKKALDLDDKYVDAYNGFGELYMFLKDYNKSKEYYRKAYLLTKEHFNELWPSELSWGILENRQYLRAICGFALCFWKDNNMQEAENLFTLLLKMNPNDNQGSRFVMAAMKEGITFEEFDRIEEKAAEKGDYGLLDQLLERQNRIHKFWSYKDE